MTIEDYVSLINIKRRKMNAFQIEVHRRPGRSNPRVETIEVRRIDTLGTVFKSQNWGMINVFLRGMLTGFVNEVLPMPSSTPIDEATFRRLEI